MKWISRLYIFFLGIILSVTTGYGLAAFYPEPHSPVYQSIPNPLPVPKSCYETPESQKTTDCQKAFEEDKKRSQEEDAKSREHEKKMEGYRNLNAAYTRTAVFFGIAAGAFYAILGLIMLKSSKLVSNGLMLAGVLTALFTRLLVGLASLGAPVAGTSVADKGAYVQFFVLLVLSFAVAFAGKVSLKDLTSEK